MKNKGLLTRVMCTFVFTLFCFYYLYSYQADLLTVMQHVLSHGQTHYNHFVGAVLITLVVLLVQIGVVRLLQQKRLAWALTFVPSALCLMMLTNINVSSDDGTLTFGMWQYLSPTFIVAFFLIVYGVNNSGVLKSLPQLWSNPIRELWVNLLILTTLLLCICSVGNSDKYFHTRIHAEQCLIDGDYDEALKVLRRHDTGDRNISMLAIYALSKKGELAERMFDYPVVDVDAMLPNGTDTRFELYPEYKLYKYLGGRYKQKMNARQYINFQRRTHHVNKPMADYVLCAHLLDRNLDAFVADLQKYYVVNDSVALPRHYREALTLYMHTHTAPAIVYKDNVGATNYEDYQTMERTYANERVRKNALKGAFGNTYWYYFDYRK